MQTDDRVKTIPERSRTVSTLWLIRCTENISVSPSSSLPNSNSVSSSISFPDSTCTKFHMPVWDLGSKIVAKRHKLIRWKTSILLQYLAEIQNVVKKPQQSIGAFANLYDHRLLFIVEAVIAHEDIQQANHCSHRRAELVAMSTKKFDQGIFYQCNQQTWSQLLTSCLLETDSCSCLTPLPFSLHRDGLSTQRAASSPWRRR